MKHLILATITAVLLTGCGPSGDPPPLTHSIKDSSQDLTQQTDIEPVLFVADGLNADGSLVENYQRGINSAGDPSSTGLDQRSGTGNFDDVIRIGSLRLRPAIQNKNE